MGPWNNAGGRTQTWAYGRDDPLASARTIEAQELSRWRYRILAMRLRLKSHKISRAALWPGAPVTPPPGLPPADAKVIISKFPRLAWGIILFDAFIMNGDRHGRNIAYDAPTGRVQIFDHSHAFLGADGDIPSRLASAAGQLCIGGHCLASEISTEDGLEFWLERIELIPDFFLEEMVKAASTVGLPAVNKSDAFAFIKDRRNDLRNIVNIHKGVFSKLPRVTP